MEEAPSHKSLADDVVSTDPSQVTKAKLIILGEGATGKTCIVRRYTENEFKDNLFATIGGV